MLHYLKFFHYYGLVLLGLGMIWMGGLAIPIGYLVFISMYVLGDRFLGDDLTTPDLSHKRWLNVMLYGSIPMTLIVFVTTLWLVSDGSFGWVTPISEWLGYDLAAAKKNTALWQTLFGIPFLGLMLSGVATVVAHEFVHRVNDKFAVCTGRWLLAFSFDANFSVEHVYNHHVHVATEKDPVTAPRGRDVYTHFVYALIGTQKAGWLIECKRLTRKGLSVWSWHNACLRGWAMTLCLLAVAFLICGWAGVAMTSGVGLFGKFILEVVNYMEHYGLVRDPRQPVQPRHSWNSNKRISCWTMFNLPRHSHHHAQGAVPFEKLKPMSDAPQMISGYISTIGIALVPPLWFKLMAPKLKEWDEVHANDRERKIIAQMKHINWQKSVA